MFNTGISPSSSYLKENCHPIVEDETSLHEIKLSQNLISSYLIYVLKFMSLSVRNLACYVQGRREAVDFQRQGAVQNSWASDGRSTGKLEKN